MREMQIKTMRYCPTLCPTEQALARRMWRKRSPRAPLVGTHTGAATMENRTEASQKIKNRNTVGSSNSSTGYVPTEDKTLTWKHICTSLFPAALIIIVKIGKQPKRPLIDGQIQKMWCINTTECYSAIKRNEIFKFVTTWVDLEDIMLSQVSQRKINTIRLYWHKKSKEQNETNKAETDP